MDPQLWKKPTSPFAIILFFFLLLFLYTKFIGPFPFSINSVQTTKTNLFQATGEGKATAVPDTAQVSAGVTKNAQTVAAAQAQVNTTVNKIMDALNTAGIDSKDIKTTDYSVTPQYNFQGNQNITGYSVTQQLTIKIKPLEKVNTVLDSLAANGANLVGQVSFTFDDQTQKDLENKARLDAVKEAKQKAESLANAAGIHLGKIVDVQENANQPIIRPLVSQMGLGAGEAKDAAQSNVTPGENSVDVTVTISYETY